MVATVARARRSSITDHGITFYFDQPYCCGQYISGRWWVQGVGPLKQVRVVNMTPIWNGQACGAEINPKAGGNGPQGFATHPPLAYTGYSSSLNKALGISSSSPLVLTPGMKLFKAGPIANPGWYRPVVTEIRALYCVDAPPAPTAFAPGVCDPSLAVQWLESRIDYSAFASLVPTSGATSSWMGTMADGYLSHPWCDWIETANAQGFFPRDMGTGMPDNATGDNYGRHFANAFGRAALLANCNFTNSQKRPLIIGMIQQAIDIRSIALNGGHRNWLSGGGVPHGRKGPLIFASRVMNDTSFSAVALGQTTPAAYFGEDYMTFYVSSEDVTRSNYNPPFQGTTFGGYTNPMIGLAEWVKDSDPRNRSAQWGASYRLVSGASAWQGQQLAMLVMGLKSAWNRDSFFDYVDRHMTVEAALLNAGTPNHYPYFLYWDVFQYAMWQQYRTSYGPLYARAAEPGI